MKNLLLAETTVTRGITRDEGGSGKYPPITITTHPTNTSSKRKIRKMNTVLQKAQFWQLAANMNNDEKVVKMWNMLFGENYQDQRIRVQTFLQEAEEHGSADFTTRMTGRKVRKFLQNEEEEPEDDTITSPEVITQAGTPTTDPVTSTTTIITSLADAVANIDIGHLPPRAAARAVKKQYWDILRPIMHSAGERAMSNAETLWQQRLQGPKTNLVSSAQSAGTAGMWREVKAISLTGVRWGMGSFESERMQVAYINEVFRIISVHLNNQLHIKILDTHDKGMRDPPCRPDITLTRADYGYIDGSSIPWSEVMSAGELKRRRSDSLDGQVQITEWAWQILEKQPGRTFVIGFILAGLNVEFIRMQRGGEVTATTPEPYLDKEVATPPAGFRRLVNFLRMDLQRFGVAQ